MTFEQIITLAKENGWRYNKRDGVLRKKGRDTLYPRNGFVLYWGAPNGKQNVTHMRQTSNDTRIKNLLTK